MGKVDFGSHIWAVILTISLGVSVLLASGSEIGRAEFLVMAAAFVINAQHHCM